MDDHEKRVRVRARRLWVEEGRPQAREEEILDKARELVAIEENQMLATKPVRRDADDPTIAAAEVEPAQPAANEGELPTLTDEGEQVYPPSRDAEAEAAAAVPPGVGELARESQRSRSRPGGKARKSG